MRRIRLSLWFALLLVTSIQAEEITIPEIHIPGRHFDAIRIPGKHIPGRLTSFGDIPPIDIPEIYIPAFDVPAVDTTSGTLVRNDLSYARVQAYKQSATRNPGVLFQLPRTAIEGRVERYLQTTKWATPEMVHLFTMFDSDHSGELTWEKAENFQRYLFDTYRYRHEAVALRPDQFLSRGEGDCKAFSLMSCEFFRFWGWTAFDAGFSNATAGHAVCFVKADVPVPSSYIKYYVTGARTAEGDPMPEGWYVPVDYFAVGSYSNAVEVGMRLTVYFTPNKVYGEAM